MIRAFICGCAGYELGADEKAFLAETSPWGLILFRRNVESPDQLRRLTSDFREAVGRADAPVLIDQEGGRVQRLAPPHWPSYPAAATYARLAETDLDAAKEAAALGGRLIGRDLHDVGITVDCAPVLDLPVPGSSNVIGNRAFGTTPETIATLGRAFAEGLLAAGVLPVVKHIPGHGRAEVDSHFELPVVQADRAALDADFEPFRHLVDLPVAMSAHVIYASIDAARPATVSAEVVKTIIRGAIGFQGLLLTDDLSMQALKGSLGERAAGAFAAGCDIGLHCNGKLDEARAVAAEAPRLTGAAAERAEAALTWLAAPRTLDVEAARRILAALLAPVTATV